MGGISIWQLLIILLIVLLLFGAKRLRTLGSDLGAAVKGFRNAVKEGEEEAQGERKAPERLEDQRQQQAEGAARVVDGEVERKEKPQA